MANSLASPVSCHHTSTLRNPASQKYFNPSTLSLKIGLKPKIEDFFFIYFFVRFINLAGTLCYLAKYQVLKKVSTMFWAPDISWSSEYLSYLNACIQNHLFSISFEFSTFLCL